MPRSFINKKTKTDVLFRACIVLFLIISVAMLIVKSAQSNQSKPPAMPRITFIGEYKIGNGDWMPIVEGEHISAHKGDVTLKGYFRMEELETEDEEKRLPQGTIVSLYLNHISVSFYMEGQEQPVVLDTENQLLGESACGQMWTGYVNTEPSSEATFVIHNPHAFGNATAVDDFLSSMYVYSSPFFEQMILEFGWIDRTVGIVAIVAALIILGIALFSSLLKINFGKELLNIGSIVLFGGIYFLFGADGVYFWNDLVVFNTLAKGLSAMFYMLFAFCVMDMFLSGKAKKISMGATAFSGVAGASCVLVSFLGNASFYNMLIFWGIAVALSGVVIIACLASDLRRNDTLGKTIRVLSITVVLAFIMDMIANVFGWWQGGFLSKNAFVLIFVMELVIVLQIIPGNINAAVKAKELEAEKVALDNELAESRISTMISQIRPHFIYNTLGSIEQLCELDPPKAAHLVHNFSKYLRGNFRELDNPESIRMSQEMEHVKYYISIENVRFPDMVFTFNMNSSDFKIPALTIQPVIENAIKHGLMKLKKGGTILVTSYETESHYYVSVEDNGVGFDTSILLDERKHIGLRNIRGRLEAMVNGTLEIESEIGVGTKVLITIPKEVEK